MIKLSTFYPNGEGRSFDKEYFMKTHLPLAEKSWGTALRRIEVDFGIGGHGPGVPPPFIAVIHLYFDSFDSFQAAVGPQHRELAQQTSRFTDIKPVVQVSAVATEQSPADSLVEKPSQTAAYVALCRALSFRDERAAIKGPDALAHLFVSENGKKSLENADAVRRGIAFTAPLYGMMVARTAFFDMKFREAVEGGIRQIVLLGAGYDTRACRFSSLLGDTAVHELDIRSTQGRKLEILRGAGIAIPPQVRHTAIDFTSESIGDVLLKNGFDRSIPALFLWEGVTCYLAENVFRDTLEGVQSFASKGSAVCFDYHTAKRESLVTAEPFRFWIKPEALVEYLSAQGFTVLDHLDSREMEKRFLTLPDGSTAEKAFDEFRFVHAGM